jgi:hypothetical protein
MSSENKRKLKLDCNCWRNKGFSRHYGLEFARQKRANCIIMTYFIAFTDRSRYGNMENII